MENTFTWPHEIRGALSLTYDDGLPVHYSLVDPLLRQNGLRATFYAMIQSDLRVHSEKWREVAAGGHELGNHSVFHPCRQDGTEAYAWLDDRYDLRSYTPKQMRDELEVANLVLHLLDGKSERSYGNTCCDTTFGSEAMERSLEPILRELFVAGRGALTNRIAYPADGIDLFNIGCIDASGRSFEELQDVVEQARAGGWAVLMLHGIGAGTHDLYLDADVHERFVSWLAKQRTIWTAPVRDIANYIKQFTQGVTQPE